MANERTGASVRIGVIVLGLFAVAATGLVVLVNTLTKERVEANERDAVLRNLYALVPRETLDNDLFNDTLDVQDPDLFGTPSAIKVFRARKQGAPVAAIFNVVAPDGYSGPIGLLVAIGVDGKVLGVRATSHKETPGLGDKIEERRTPWVHAFEQRDIQNPPPEKWAVKRDGGVFDQFSGATVTPRAVVKAVKNALIYFSRHRDEVFAARDQR